MLLDPNYKSACKFGEDIVAYLYDEIDVAGKLRFESHLENCHSCTDELAGLSFVRSSVLEWRQEEFSPLATPVMEIQVDKAREILPLASEIKDSRSFITRLQDSWRISPGRLTWAVGFASFLVCAGLLFVVFKLQQTKDMAKYNSNRQVEKQVVFPSSDGNKVAEKIAPSDSKEQTIDVAIAEKPDAKTTKQKNNQKEEPVPVKVNLPIRTGNTKTPKSVVNSENKPINRTLAKSPNKTKRPSLTGDDDDDETLRLADLFEEASLR